MSFWANNKYKKFAKKNHSNLYVYHLVCVTADSKSVTLEACACANKNAQKKEIAHIHKTHRKITEKYEFHYAKAYRKNPHSTYDICLIFSFNCPVFHYVYNYIVKNVEKAYNVSFSMCIPFPFIQCVYRCVYTYLLMK